MSFSKRARQLTALILHPSCILSRYDTPWDNVLYSTTRNLFSTNRISYTLIDELSSRMGINRLADAIVAENLYDSSRSAGSVSPYELTVISRICRLLLPKVILEIGTFEGRTTLNMAINSPGAEIFTVCLPPDKCSFQIGRFFAESPERARIHQILGDSRTLDYSRIPSPDLIFIDGDHSYEGVLGDTRNAFRILSQKGAILWHDFDPCHLGSVTAALGEIEKNGFSYSAIDGSTLAIAYRVGQAGS